MEISIIGLLVVQFVVPIASQSAIPRCLLSREDYVPCLYRNKDLIRAQANQFSAHFTRIKLDLDSKETICNVRAKDQNVSTIPNQGTDEMRVLHSPGYLSGKQYKSEMRVEYLVQCGEDQLAFYNITHLDTQSKEDCKNEEGKDRCQDYLQIVTPSAGTVEECGTTPSQSSVLQLESGNFTVVFRTSEDLVVGDGFQMYVICYRPDETSLPGCVNESEFTSGVCVVESGDNSSAPPTTETKRSVGAGQQGPRPIATFYTDLFPDSGYPPNLRIAPDLALFHQQWNRLKGRPGVILFEVDVLRNQTVNFSDKTVTIMDLDGNILTWYCIVNVLETFNSDGVIERHVGRVKTYRNPHFRGPGLLRIVRRCAYFQLFRFDPRGVVPNEEQQRQLLLMNTPLLDSLLVSNSTLYRPRRPRDTNSSEFSDSDRGAVLAALRSEDSCNAVLRAQSRATLTFYSEIDMNYVECLRTFNVSCSVIDRILVCVSDTITLPGRTLCQADEQTPVICDPFREDFEVPLTLEATTVTVTTINCEGQTAVHQVEL